MERMSISGFLTSVDDYARGKKWYWYGLLWLLGLYGFIELFQLDMAHNQMPFIWIVPYSFNFAIHELAHIFTAWLPPVLTASAGSGSEILLGILLVVMAFWQRSYFASLLCFLWFDLSCQSAGQYMADAIPRQIPLVSLGAVLSGGGEAKHDWNFVFGQLGLLNQSAFIGNSVRFIGVVAGLLGLLFTAYVIFRMSQISDRPIAETASRSLSPLPLSSYHTQDPIKDDGFTSLPIDDHGSVNPEHSQGKSSSGPR